MQRQTTSDLNKTLAPIAGSNAWANKRSYAIEASRQRSMSYGLRPDKPGDEQLLGRTDLSLLIEQNRLLHTHAVPAMETLYQQIVNTHNMVILTDANGVILHSLGDDDFLEKANRVALQAGAAWSEQSKGTNAIGTAIAEKTPTLVHADQHYLTANHFLTCSAAPVIDHLGKVIGILDVSGDRRSFHQHTMALVRMSTLMIENQLFSANFEEAITLHFHTRAEFIGTLMEGIASFSPGGRFLAANRNGLFQLGLSHAALCSHTFSSLFGLPISALYEHYRTASPDLLKLCMHSGLRVCGRAQLRLPKEIFQQSLAPQPQDAGAADHRPAAPKSISDSRLSGLRYLCTGDPQMERVIDKVGKVIGRDIPIIIMGETGTGKELLAQAIHHDSSRRTYPFIALNCASIPESLIESELFGYADGAFTGARKKGAPGKILQADRGTLFLDEIGDMPIGMQARLLRTLQERLVTPLGSDRSIPVDLQLICATNHNLRERINQQMFREDLYYRLNGLVVKLPPLRERTDLETVVRKILGTASDNGPYTVSPDILRLFRQHQWPGNFRQLNNLLRTAIVMAGDEREIGVAHMPDDFLDDVMSTSAGRVSDRGLVATTRNLNTMEQLEIRKALAAHHGNVSAAARTLGISRNTIYRKIADLE
jgi:transcriptional regulator of acetoin/glycerol metabolism